MASQTQYPIIANCNYESAEDTTIHEIRLAVDAGLTDDPMLLDALDALEATLTEDACEENPYAVGRCNEAERDVLDAWTETIQATVTETRQSRWDRG